MSSTRPIFEVNRPKILVGDVVRIRHESGVYAGFDVVGTRPNWLKVCMMPFKKMRRRYGFIHIDDVDAVERDGAVVWVGDVMVECTGA